MEQVFDVELTSAAPVVAVPLAMTEGGYYKVTGAQMIADNDNASATVQIQAVVSRSSAPLADGSLATSDAMRRGDALLLAETVPAGRALVLGELTGGDFVLRDTELFSSEGGAYLGVKAVGLESGKVAKVQVRLQVDTASATTANQGVYLSQVIKFRDC